MIIRGSIHRVVFVGATVAVLAACGNGRDPGLSRSSAAHAGARVIATVPAGGTATVAVHSVSGDSTFTVKVNSVTCGVAAAAAIADKVTYSRKTFGIDHSADEHAPSSMQWCVVALATTNTGNTSANWALSYGGGGLDVGVTAYRSDGAAASLSDDFDQWAHATGQASPTFGVNPGVSGTDYTVFLVPTGAEPTSIWIDQSTDLAHRAGIRILL